MNASNRSRDLSTNLVNLGRHTHISHSIICIQWSRLTNPIALMCIRGRKSKKRANKKQKRSSTSSCPNDSTPDLKSKQVLESTTSPSEQTPTPVTKRTAKSTASSKERDDTDAIENIKSFDTSLDRNAIRKMFERKRRPKNVERKIGDVTFGTLGSLVRSERAEDDTKMERNWKSGRKGVKKVSVGCNEAVSVTTVEEQDMDAPNEENFMANLVDMDFMVHDIMRVMTKQKAGEVVTREKVDPYGPLPDLEDPKLFGWNALKANTYHTNANCLPTQEEAEHVPTMKDTADSLQFRFPVVDLATFAANINQNTVDKSQVETASVIEKSIDLKTVKQPSKVLSFKL